MANQLYVKFKESLLGAGTSLSADTIKAVLVDTAAYTLDINVHDNLNDVAAGSRIATSGALASKTITDGIFDAADVTFTAVTGASCEAIILYKDTGVESTSTLIAYLDTATGLPVTPNGTDIIIQWDSGTNKIFKL